VPFDDPNTHLELTMIHEVMVLDHSGPPLAAILHGASLKLLLFAVLLAEAACRSQLSLLQAIGALVVSVFVVAIAIGLVESLLARLAFRRVPLLLTTAFLLCLFALLVAWKEARHERHDEFAHWLGDGFSLVALASSRLPSVIRAAAFKA